MKTSTLLKTTSVLLAFLICSLILSSAASASSAPVYGTLVVTSQDTDEEKWFVQSPDHQLNSIPTPKDSRKQLLGEEVVYQPGKQVTAYTAKFLSPQVSLNGAKKVAIVRLNVGTLVPQDNDQQIRQVVTSSSNNLARQSQNRVSLSGVNHAVADIFSTSVVNNSTCDYQAYATAALNAIPNPNAYTNIMIYMGYNPNCNWAGLGIVDGSITWYNENFNQRVLVHELGHNFGLDHANALHCKNTQSEYALEGNCSVVEYGDPFDVMGTGSLTDFSAFYQVRAGLMPETTVEEVKQAGVYNLNASNLISSNTKGVLIPRVNPNTGTYDQYLYVEIRDKSSQWISNTDAYDGLMVRYVSRIDGYGEGSTLVKASSTPHTGSFIKNISLPVGDTFVDPVSGVQIKLLSLLNTQAQISVVMSKVEDRTPPATPQFYGYSMSNSNVQLTWRTVTDPEDSPVAYQLARNGQVVYQGMGNSFLEATPGGTHEYRVRSYDNANNFSAWSNPLSVTVSSNIIGGGKIQQPEIKQPEVKPKRKPSRPTHIKITRNKKKQYVLSWKTKSKYTLITHNKKPKMKNRRTKRTKMVLKGFKPRQKHVFKLYSYDKASKQKSKVKVWKYAVKKKR